MWEFLSNTEVMNIVIPYYKNMDGIGAANKLVEESVRSWRNVRIII